MYRRFGMLALIMAMAIPAQAEQTTQDPLGPTDSAMEQATEQAVAPQQAEGEMVEQAGFSKGSVVRSAFTSAVEDREPTDSLETVSTEQNQLYFFTELRDMSGQTAKHRWEYDGKVMAEVEFNVKGDRWRVWSSKSFVPGWTGDWKVSVINGAGEVISEKAFSYETAAAGQAAEPINPAQ